MKVFRIVVLLVLSAIGLSSCNWLFGHEEPEYDYVVYNLAIGFRDASGKDLVEGIGLKESQWENVDTGLYELEVLRSGFPVAISPRLRMECYDANYYFSINFLWAVDADTNEEQLTYRLKCPYVFGDDAVHELIAHWNIPKEKIASNEYFGHCVRIEFEGSEIIPDKCDNANRGYWAVLTVVERTQVTDLIKYP